MIEQAAPRPAVTVAAVVERDGAFLLVRERTRRGLRLNQPAGHLESGESLAEGAARETLEEAAWRVEPFALVGIYRWQAPDNGATFVRFAFAARPVAHEPGRRLDTEIVDAQWLRYDEVVAWLLKRQGYDVVGVFMKNWEDDDTDIHCTSREDLVDAASVADVVGIDLQAVNFAEAYRERVFAQFLREY